MCLVLEGISKLHGPETHLAHITTRLETGSLNVVLGPTLAGKTSLLRVMAGLDAPTAGRLLWKDIDITGQAPGKRSVAMVYQQFINYPNLRVYDNIASPLRRRGLTASEIDRRVRITAEMLRIESYLQRMPSELSGGQQQRTAIARALVKEAELLLLDEPLVNLDYKLREELRSELKGIFSSKNAMVVYATTEPLEALQLGGQCLVMNEGRLLQQGPTVDVFRKPTTLEVGRVFSDPPINTLEGEVKGGSMTIGNISFPSLTAQGQGGIPPGRYRFGIRAHHLQLRRRYDNEIGFRAMVNLSEINGSETFIHIEHGGTAWVVQEEGVHSLKIGSAIDVYFDPRHLFVFDDRGRLILAPQDGQVRSTSAGGMHGPH